MAHPTTTTTQTSLPPQPPLTLLIGLSGPSSSGKTTLARLLRQLFNFPSPLHPTTSPSTSTTTPALSLFILHQDDFYHTDALIPLITTPPNCPSGLGARELQDWDCVESLDLELLGRTLDFISRWGRCPVRSDASEGSSVEGGGDGPTWGESKEDQNSVGPVDLPEGLLETLRAELEEWWAKTALERSQSSTSPPPPVAEVRLCVLDGFLLYPDPDLDDKPESPSLQTAVSDHLDLKLLILATRSQTISRRTHRTGYVTLEGFWEDPEGYVEDVVWANWERDGGWLMRAGNVSADGNGDGKEEGRLDPMVDVNEDVAREAGIRVAPGRGEWGLGELLRWVVGEVKGVVEGGVLEGR